MKVPMATLLILPDDIDWATIPKLELTREGQVTISRKPNEVAVEITVGVGEHARK